jgi:hypothetical protein
VEIEDNSHPLSSPHLRPASPVEKNSHSLVPVHKNPDPEFFTEIHRAFNKPVEEMWKTFAKLF